MDDAPVAGEPAALTLLPEVEVRRAFGTQRLTFRLLAPPFPALGVGRLRVLRIAERGDTREIVAGYERYERIAEVRRT